MNIFEFVGNRKFMVPAAGLGCWHQPSKFTDIIFDILPDVVKAKNYLFEARSLIQQLNKFTDDSIGSQHHDECNRYIKDCNIVVLGVFEHYQLEIRHFKGMYQWRYANV